MKKLFTALIVAVVLANVSVAEQPKTWLFMDKLRQKAWDRCNEQFNNDDVLFGRCYENDNAIVAICFAPYLKNDNIFANNDWLYIKDCNEKLWKLYFEGHNYHHKHRKE